jgi:hypothetical protein
MLRPNAIILNFAMLMDYVLLGFMRPSRSLQSQNITASSVLLFQPAGGLLPRRWAAQECSPAWALGPLPVMPRCTPQSMAW